MTTTKTELAQYDVTITMAGTNNGQLGSKDPITVRVPAASAEQAEQVGRALGNAINEATDRIVCWPLGIRNLDVQPVVDTVDPEDAPEDLGPREAFARNEAARLGFRLSEADVEHARHVDNCAKCQEEEDDRRTQYLHEQRLENSRTALLSFLFQIQDTLKVLGNWKAADKPLPPTQEFIDKLEKAARRAQSAYQRAMKS